MTFDLYATTAAATKKPAKTTLDELAAAKWQEISPGRWKMQWADRTPDYGYGEDGHGQDFTCELYREDGQWIYDYWHSDRGGEQLNNELRYQGHDEALAQLSARKSMEKWIDRWTEDCEEDARQAAEDEDE